MDKVEETNTLDYEPQPKSALKQRALPPRDEMGDGICNGLLVGCAAALVVLVIVGGLIAIVGDGNSEQTIVLLGFILFPVGIVIGGAAGGVRVFRRYNPAE